MGASLNLYKLLSPNAFEQLQYTVERDNIRKKLYFYFGFANFEIRYLATREVSENSRVVSE